MTTAHALTALCVIAGAVAVIVTLGSSLATVAAATIVVVIVMSS